MDWLAVLENDIFIIKFMAKLQNIKAIRQMLDGTHRTQTRTSVSFAQPTSKTHEVGEVWTDANGNEWEQREGYKIQKGKLDEIRSLLAKNQMPAHCPKCSKQMNKKLDRKFWLYEKHCFDCQVAFEHTLRIEGKYADYEKDRMRRNAESWLKDAEQEAMELVEAFRNPLSFANADGTIEKWTGGQDPEEIAQKIEEEFRNFKENFLLKLTTEND